MRGGGRTTAGLNAQADRGKTVKPKPGAPASGYGGTDQVIQTNPMARYRTLAARLEAAARAWSWKGSAPPADWARLDANLHTARANLEAFVKSLLPKEDSQ